jgi:guanylate kinase
MADRPALDEDARALGRERAVEARRRRARVKQELADGLPPGEVLARRLEDPAVGRMRVRELIEACPGIGPARSSRILSDCGIAESRRLRGLGEHQVTSLISALGGGSMKRGRLMVLSGPSGVGKSSIVTYLRAHHPEIHFSVSATTRSPRPGEIDGVDYHFVDAAGFQRLIDDDALLEWADFAGHRYGTPARPVEQALASGRDVLLEIELQGARQVRRTAPEALHIFLAPPSWEVLVDRLEGRRTESADVIARRLDTARIELAAEPEFDVSVVNTSVPDAAAQLVSLFGGSVEEADVAARDVPRGL